MAVPVLVNEGMRYFSGIVVFVLNPDNIEMCIFSHINLCYGICEEFPGRHSMIANNNGHICILLNNHKVAVLIENVFIRLYKIDDLYGLFQNDSLGDPDKNTIRCHSSIKMNESVRVSVKIFTEMLLKLITEFF